MITTLGIAVLNRGDLLFRAIKSVDHPIQNLVIVNNSNGQDPGVAEVCRQVELRDFPNAGLFEEIRVHTQKNLGCGPSWNHVFRNHPGPWLISGNDIAFLPGSLALMDGTAEKNPDAAIVFGDGYNVFLMMPLGIEKVGYFDENFYPAYYEDCDHWRRGVLAGVKLVGVDGFKRLHGESTDPGDSSKGSNTVRSNQEYLRKNGITMQNNWEYYVRKWGGAPAKETYPTPYNKSVPMTFWELDPSHRQKNDLW